MTKPIARGYKTLHNDDVQVDQWLLSLGNLPVTDLPDLLPDWTSSIDLTVSLRFGLDFDAIHKRLGLHASAHIAADIQWYSPETGLAGSSVPKRLVGNSTSIEVEIDGRKVGGRLELTAEVILLDPGLRSGDDRAPGEPGSILWRSQRSVILEGEGSRMPVEAHSFRELGTVRGDDAVWYLNIEHRDYEAPVGSALSLWINSDNEAGVAVLEPNVEGRDLILKIILAAVSRQIADIGLSDPDFDLEADYPVGSLGATIQNLLTATELSMSDLKALREQDSPALDARIQSHTWSLL